MFLIHPSLPLSFLSPLSLLSSFSRVRFSPLSLTNYSSFNSQLWHKQPPLTNLIYGSRRRNEISPLFYEQLSFCVESFVSVSIIDSQLSEEGSFALRRRIFCSSFPTSCPCLIWRQKEEGIKIKCHHVAATTVTEKESE